MAADKREQVLKQTVFDIKSTRESYPKGTVVVVLDGLLFLGQMYLRGKIPWKPFTGYYVEFPDSSRHFVEPEALEPVGAKTSLTVIEGGKSD